MQRCLQNCPCTRIYKDQFDLLFLFYLQAFFAATDQILHSKDVTYEAEVDAEILGVGTITAFTIISPMLLLAYAIHGRKALQGTHLDCIFCFVGACLFIASGGI